GARRSSRGRWRPIAASTRAWRWRSCGHDSAHRARPMATLQCSRLAAGRCEPRRKMENSPPLSFWRIRHLMTAAIAALLFAAPLIACAQSLSPQQRLARDIYKELIEINTVTATGDTAKAAEAMAARVRSAG